MFKKILFICGLILSINSSTDAYIYPQAEKSPHIDLYVDVPVADPYRWLENPEDAKTLHWIAEQNHLTEELLSGVPERQQIKRRLTALMLYERISAPIPVGEHLLFQKNDGTQNQSILYIQKKDESDPEIFFDPNLLSQSGLVSVKEIVPSQDGTYVAFSLCYAGSDRETIRVMHVPTLTLLSEVIEDAKFSCMSWDSNGFYYNRVIAAEDPFYYAVYYHAIGQPQENDQLIFTDKDNPQRFYKTQIFEEGRYLLLNIWKGSSNTENAIWIKDLLCPESSFKPLFADFSHYYHILHMAEDQCIVLTNCHAPNNRLVLINLHDPSEHAWQELIPEKEDLLEWAAVAGGKLFACYSEHASDHLYQYDLKGHFENALSFPGHVCIDHFHGLRDDKETYFSVTSYTTPTIPYQYDINTGDLQLWKPVTLPFDPGAFITKLIFITSKDGTRIPLYLVHKKDVIFNGSTPALLYGYGGFGICMSPRFDASRILFLEQGGVLAVPIIRGGGEYGLNWHRGGSLLNKQNGFDDFIAAAEYLIHAGYTSTERLVINGKSNGGLLVGACMTQRPDLFRAAIPEVGVLDMLRFHLFTVGRFWIPEYGCSTDPWQFKNLLAYSPLHQIKEGVDYPATLIVTADHDDRVVPAHSYKFAAALQEKSSSKNPILLRVEADAGHGLGKPLSKVLDLQVDILSFIFWQTKAKVAFGPS